MSTTKIIQDQQAGILWGMIAGGVIGLLAVALVWWRESHNCPTPTTVEPPRTWGVCEPLVRPEVPEKRSKVK